MNWFKRTFGFSIGRKLLMGITGLFLYSFLFVHAGGNLLLFSNDGGKAFEEFSHFMTTNPLIRIIEIVLFASMIIHSIDGIMLSMQNRKARTNRYEVYKVDTSKVELSSRFMIVSGLIILLFLIIHIGGIYVPYRILDTVNQPNGEGLYMHTLEVLRNPLLAVLYIVAVILLGWHLHHGVASAFQTLGLRHPNFYTAVKSISILLTVAVCGAFISMPIYFLLNN